MSREPEHPHEDVELCRDPDAFVASPVGRCLIGEHIVAWFRSEELQVTAVWGAPTDADIDCLLAMKRARCRPGARPHRSLINLQDLQQAERSHFERIHAFSERHCERLNQLALAGAVVRPAGFVGAAVEGFYALLREPSANRIFTSLPEALAWLGVPAAGSLLAGLSQLVACAQKGRPAVDELRRYLREHSPDVSLPVIARALGVSARTLQRQLTESGTSFQKEMNAARVRRAQELLRTTDLKLLAIGLEVGLRKPQHLSALFRRLTGETPAAFRRRLRPDDPRPGL
jgi:AraC-like DNA-binding protein